MVNFIMRYRVNGVEIYSVDIGAQSVRHAIWLSDLEPANHEDGIRYLYMLEGGCEVLVDSWAGIHQ